MRVTMLTAIVAITLAATLGSVSAAGQAAKPDAKPVAITSANAVSAAGQLATLRGVKAVPMASRELDAVKGLHVHFLDANGGFHLAGDIKTMNNWQNLGGSDGRAVAPSYHGLCVAAGISSTGGISIPGAAVQCR